MEILMIEGNPFWVEPNGLTKHVEELVQPARKTIW